MRKEEVIRRWNNIQTLFTTTVMDAKSEYVRGMAATEFQMAVHNLLQDVIAALPEGNDK